MVIKTILNGLYFSGLDQLATGLAGNSAGIWMLHRVSGAYHRDFSPNAHLSVAPEFLDLAILHFKQNGYRFVSLDELAELMKTGIDQPEQQRLIAITLDDGYRDNLENAVPVFRRHKVPYTIFVAPGLVEGSHNIWWEDLEHVIADNRKISLEINNKATLLDTGTPDEKRRVFAQLIQTLRTEIDEDGQRKIMDRLCKVHNRNPAAYTKTQIMGWNELRKLAVDPLCTIGAHTIGHFAVARLDSERARFEMEESRSILQNKLNVPAKHFAYPYGCTVAVSRRDHQIAADLGFETAVTTQYGLIAGSQISNMHALPRVSLNGLYQSLRYLQPLMSPVPQYLYSLAGKKKAA